MAEVRSALVFSRSAALAEYGGFPDLHYYVMEGRHPSALALLSDMSAWQSATASSASQANASAALSPRRGSRVASFAQAESACSARSRLL